MDAAVHIVVRGLVQGVGFRYFVHARAAQYGLSGFVRNLWNGDVEIEAEGDRSLIETLIGDIRAGPRAARVTGLDVRWKDAGHRFAEFEIR